MRGMDSVTGKHIDDLPHLRQSIADRLTTRKGTRVHRRDYGSDLPNLVDIPVSSNTLIEFYAATAEALLPETRINLSRVKINSATSEGRLVLDLELIYLPDGREITLEGIQVERD